MWGRDPVEVNPFSFSSSSFNPFLFFIHIFVTNSLYHDLLLFCKMPLIALWYEICSPNLAALLWPGHWSIAGSILIIITYFCLFLLSFSITFWMLWMQPFYSPTDDVMFTVFMLLLRNDFSASGRMYLGEMRLVGYADVLWWTGIKLVRQWIEGCFLEFTSNPQPFAALHRSCQR